MYVLKYIALLLIAGIAIIPASSHVRPYGRNQIIIFGDSHAWAVTYTNKKETSAGSSWNDILGTRNVTQHGYAGFTTMDIWNRETITTLIKAQPKRVFLIIGGNDAWKDSSLTQSVIYFDAICDRIHDAGISLVLMTIPSFENGSVNGLDDTKKVIRRYAQLNTYIREYATFHGYEYIDLEKHFHDTLSAPYLPKGYTYDGLHFNKRGYQKWRDPVLKVLSHH